MIIYCIIGYNSAILVDRVDLNKNTYHIRADFFQNMRTHDSIKITQNPPSNVSEEGDMTFPPSKLHESMALYPWFFHSRTPHCAQSSHSSVPATFGPWRPQGVEPNKVVGCSSKIHTDPYRSIRIYMCLYMSSKL